MKKWNYICLALIAVCLALFFGYRTWDQLRTDSTAPQIHISSEIPSISVHDPESVLLAGITATDNRDGDVTDSLLVEKLQRADSSGNVNVTCVAFDAAGNVSRAVYTVNYSDYESPTIRFTRPLAFPQNTSFEVLDIVLAEDVVDGDLSAKVRATSLSEMNLSTRGTHDVEFRVTNSLGDTVKLVVPVEVYPAGLYNASVTLTDYLVHLPRNAQFDAEDYLSSFTGGGTAYSLQGNIPQELSLKITEDVDTAVPGTYCVDYQISKGSDIGYSRLIVIVEG